MAKAEFWQRGEALDYTNTTTATIPANTIVKIGDHIGVTGTDIEPNKVGSLHVGGIWEIPKTGTKKIDMGATVYFDGNGITDTATGNTAVGNGITDTATGNTAVGYAAASATAEDTKILVKLDG